MCLRRGGWPSTGADKLANHLSGLLNFSSLICAIFETRSSPRSHWRSDGRIYPMMHLSCMCQRCKKKKKKSPLAQAQMPAGALMCSFVLNWIPSSLFDACLHPRRGFSVSSSPFVCLGPVLPPTRLSLQRQVVGFLKKIPTRLHTPTSVRVCLQEHPGISVWSCVTVYSWKLELWSPAQAQVLQLVSQNIQWAEVWNFRGLCLSALAVAGNNYLIIS